MTTNDPDQLSDLLNEETKRAERLESLLVKVEEELREKFGFDEYASLALRTRGPLADRNEVLKWVGLGIAGEAGEIADSIKKMLYQGHPIDLEKIAEEAGDVLWYLALLSETVDVPLSQIADRNLKKLRMRYPDGFDPTRSIRR